MSLRLDGRNPLAYMGVNPNQPPQLVTNRARPTTTNTNFNLGTLWLIPEQDAPLNSMELWTLISLTGNVATWVQLYPGSGSGGTNDFITDSGTAAEVSGEINILGGSNIGTTGAGNTVTINLDSTVSVSGSITAGTTLNSTGDTNVGDDLTVTDDVTISSFGAGVVQSDGAGMLSSTNGSNGQLLIGGGSAPVWNNLTSTGGTVTITNGANAINLESMGGGGSSAGSLVFLAEQTATADATLDFTTQITNTYNEFFILLENLKPTVAGKDFIVQLSVNGGGAWITTGYINVTGIPSTNGITLIAENSGTIPTTNSISDGSVYLMNATSGSGIVGITPSTSGIYDSVAMTSQGANNAGFYATPNLVVNALRFQYSDGNVFDGTVKIYGLATTPIPMTGGGSLVFIEKQTATADATLDFTTGITNNYNHYYVILNQINPSVANKRFVVQISTDGGSTWKTTNYLNSSTGTTIGLELVGIDGVAQPSVTSFTCTTSVLQNVTSGVGYVQSTTGLQSGIFDPVPPNITNTGGNGAYRTINQVVNAFRFKYTDDSPFNGDIEVYGYSTTPVTPVASGGLVFLEEQTSSGSTELDFTTSVTSTYNDYYVSFENLQPAVADKSFIYQLSIDGGGTWITTGYLSLAGITSGIVLVTNSGTGVPQITSFSSGESHLFNVTSGTQYVTSNGAFSILNPGTSFYTNGVAGGAYNTQSTAVNAFRFKYSDGAAFDGTVKLYGYVD